MMKLWLKFKNKGNTNLRYYISMDLKENEENGIISMEKTYKRRKGIIRKR